MNDHAGLRGYVVCEMFDPDGNLKARSEGPNLVTQVGDQVFAERGAGIGTAPPAPTGCRIGTGTTAVAKTGTGAALVTRVTGGNLPPDATYPQSALSGGSQSRTPSATPGARRRRRRR